MGGNTQAIIGVVIIVVAIITQQYWAIPIGAGMLIGAVATTMAEQKAKKARQQNSQVVEQNGHLINTQDTQEVVRLLYGRIKTGGNIVYIATTGSANEYLHMIITLGEGEMEACEQVWLDDKPITDFGALAYYEFFNGNANQTVCATLNTAKPEWTDPLRHTAYLYVRLQYDPNKFTGTPTVTALIKGMKLFDPRTSITTWTQNPMCVFYDLFTNKRYAFGFASSLLDNGSLTEAGNWLATNSYQLNGGIFAQDAGLDVVEQIMSNFRAVSIYNAGKYKLKVLDSESPVMSLTEDDIKAGSFSFNVPGLPETPNRTRVKFPNAGNGYNTEDLIVEDLNALTIEGYERENTLTLIGTTDWAQAQKLAVYNLERSRLNKAYHFIAGTKALPLEHGDCISITHSLPGWTNKLCRVIAMAVSGQHEISLSVIEEDSLLYNDVIDIDTHTYSSTTLPNPLAAPPEATNISFAEEEYYNKDVSYTRLKVTFTNPASPFWSYSEVWVNVNSAGYTHYADVTGAFTVEPVKEVVNYKIKMISVSINGVKQTFSTATEWSYNVIGMNTPPGNVQNFRAIPQSDTIILMWDAVNIVDLQGYEIRKGTNWGGGVFIGFTRALTFQLNGVAPGTHSYMIKSIDTNAKYSNGFALTTATVYGPASYTEKLSEANDFSTPAAWQATTAYSLGNKVIPTTPNGYYYKCTTAGTSAGTAPTWPTANGGTVTDNTVVWTCYTAQVFSNTERYNDPTYGWLLRVYHTGGLSGTYTSPVYDRGSSVTRRSWPQFDNLFLGTGTAWIDQFTSTGLWTDKFSGSDTWLTLFGAYIAGTLKMRFAVSINGTTWTWFDNFESYVIETQGRYVKYEITITDVATDGYLCVLPMTLKEAYWS